MEKISNCILLVVLITSFVICEVSNAPSSSESPVEETGNVISESETESPNENINSLDSGDSGKGSETSSLEGGDSMESENDDSGSETTSGEEGDSGFETIMHEEEEGEGDSSTSGNGDSGSAFGDFINGIGDFWGTALSLPSYILRSVLRTVGSFFSA